MALRYYTMSYGSPGDVENNRIIVPKTLAEFKEKAKTAKESEGGLLECTARGRSVSGEEGAQQQILLNVEAVESVCEVA